MPKKEQDAYAMQMSLQGAEFGQAELLDIEASSLTDTSYSGKRKDSYYVMQDQNSFRVS